MLLNLPYVMLKTLNALLMQRKVHVFHGIQILSSLLTDSEEGFSATFPPLQTGE